MKTCRVCLKEKPEGRFETIPHSGNKRKMCRECEYERESARPNFKHNRRNSTLKHRYGVTVEQYDRMLEAQDERCMICNETESRSSTKNLSIDHDHTCCPGRSSCGKCVRGLLCYKCNSGVGLFGDDPEKLIAAAAYIKKFRGE